jgi:hypothetical protein
MKKALVYGTGLIALYLGVNYATGSGSLLKNGAAGGVSIIKAFQGR